MSRSWSVFKNKLVHEQKQRKARDIEPHKLLWHHNDADKAFSTLGSDLIRSSICLRDIYISHENALNDHFSSESSYPHEIPLPVTVQTL
jgi:hypothetical protein